MAYLNPIWVRAFHGVVGQADNSVLPQAVGALAQPGGGAFIFKSVIFRVKFFLQKKWFIKGFKKKAFKKESTTPRLSQGSDGLGEDSCRPALQRHGMP